MPTYEYHCQKCGEGFTRIEHVEEHVKQKTRCPKCNSTEVQQVFAPFFAKTSKKS